MAEDIQAELIDPEICRKPTAAEVPRLAIAANPEVILLSGKHATDRLKTARDLAALQGGDVQWHFAVPAVAANLPSTATGKLRGGDLVAHFEHVHAGDLTVCAFTIGGDLADSASWVRLRNHAEQLAIKCEPIAPDANLAVVAVPPQPRLD